MTDSAAQSATTETETPRPWVVYIVRCADRSLYTGVTTDAARRLKEHNGSRLAARYTRGRQPVRLVYQEQVEDRAAATRREYEIKQLSRSAKEGLIRSYRPQT